MSAECREVRERFSERYDGELSAQSEERVGEHLGSCRECRAVWERFASALDALRGSAPPAPPASAPRRTASWRPAGPGRLRAPAAWAIAAVLLAAAAILVPRAPAPVPETGAPSACVEPLFSLWAVDVAGFRTGPPATGPERTLEVGGGRVALPAALVSRGPYVTATGLARRANGTVCVPLLAPYGDVLVLSVDSRAGGGDTAPLVSADPTRVSYARARWAQGGRRFVLEGRVPEDQLLALAVELAAGAPRDVAVARPRPPRPPPRAGYEAFLRRPLGTRSRGML